MPVLSDEELCAQVRRDGGKSSEAEQDLVRRYLSTVRSITRPYYLAGGDSEDLMQEGMIGLLMAIRQFDPDKEARFSAFASRCIRNRVFNVIKAASRQKHQPLENYVSLTGGAGPDVQGIPWVAGPEDEFLRGEADHELRGRLDTLLSPMENRVLGDYLDGLSYRDIARRIGRTEKSVDNAVQRIRKKLTAHIDGRS
jgi:RNA polymerase sporulation-specific sigma factor